MDKWLCDDCWQRASRLLAECEDGCNRSLDHAGACHPREHRGTRCQECGRRGRLSLMLAENR